MRRPRRESAFRAVQDEVRAHNFNCDSVLRCAFRVLHSELR